MLFCCFHIRQLNTEDRANNAAYQAAAPQSALKIAETNADLQAYGEIIQVLEESLENLKVQQA